MKARPRHHIRPRRNLPSRIDINPNARSYSSQQRRTASRSIRRIDSQQLPTQRIGEHLSPGRVNAAATDETQRRCPVVLIEQVERLAKAEGHAFQHGV